MPMHRVTVTAVVTADVWIEETDAAAAEAHVAQGTGTYHFSVGCTDAEWAKVTPQSVVVDAVEQRDAE